jgi:hypothetical protein
MPTDRAGKPAGEDGHGEIVVRRPHSRAACRLQTLHRHLPRTELAAFRRTGRTSTPQMAFSAHRTITRAHTSREAVAQIAADLAAPDLRGVIAFCSPRYDIAELGAALASGFAVPVTACTAAQQLGPEGTSTDCIVAAGLYGDVSMTPHLITPLEHSMRGAFETAGNIRRGGAAPQGSRRFGLLLVNGESAMEERLAAMLYQSLDNVPFVGGTPSGTTDHPRSMVYHDGRFLSDAAVFTLIETSAGFRPVMMSPTEATETMLICTSADPETRRIFTLNGLPAAEMYARAIGVRVDELDERVFSLNPLMMRIGRRDYVRGVRAVNTDGSLSFWCAIDEGLVLRVGSAVSDPTSGVRQVLEDSVRALGVVKLSLCLHSAMRRIALQQSGHTAMAEEMYRRMNVIGCVTRGEQFNAIHTSQTLVGVVLG